METKGDVYLGADKDYGMLRVFQDMKCEECNLEKTDVYRIGAFQYRMDQVPLHLHPSPATVAT